MANERVETLDHSTPLNRGEFVAAIIPSVIDKGVDNALVSQPALRAVTTRDVAIGQVREEIARRMIHGVSSSEEGSISARIASIVMAINDEPPTMQIIGEKQPLPHAENHPLVQMLRNSRTPIWQRLTIIDSLGEFLPFLKASTDKKDQREFAILIDELDHTRMLYKELRDPARQVLTRYKVVNETFIVIDLSEIDFSKPESSLQNSDAGGNVVPSEATGNDKLKDQTSGQERVPINVEEQVSRLEAILDNPTNTWRELGEVSRLANDLAKTHPDLSRRVITDYFEVHIPKYQVSNEFGIETYIISILTALGDSKEVKGRIDRYIRLTIADEMGDVTPRIVNTDHLARIIFLATDENPAISEDIGRVLIKQGKFLKTSFEIADRDYTSRGQYSKNADSQYERLDRNEHRYRNIAVALVAMAGQIAVESQDRELGQETLNGLSIYADDIADAKKYIDGSYSHKGDDDPPRHAYLISAHSVEMFYNITNQLKTLTVAGQV